MPHSAGCPGNDVPEARIEEKALTTRPKLGTRRAAILLAVFLVSGATSLVYQVLWVRVLSLTLGSTVLSISLVVSAFMAGLALGSAVLGKRSDRAVRPLRVYAYLELGIGIAAILLPLVFTGMQNAAVGSSGFARAIGSPLGSFLLTFLFLLVPTTLMGGTLPVLCRAVAGFQTPRGASIGALYAANTIGAILGSLVTGFVLIRVVGIQKATWIAAGGNLLVFVFALLLARRWPTAPVPDAARENTASDEESARLIVPVSIVYTMNGFAGLALEVLWTRAILLLTTNTIYAFTVILTTFLLGIGLGSAVMSPFVTRLRRPVVWLGWFQCGVALLAAATPFLIGEARFSWLEPSNDAGSALLETGGALPAWLRASSIPQAYAVAIFFILPATLLMGASFPLVARIIAGTTEKLGGAVGRIYALNTIGAVAGSLIAGFLLVPLLGIQRSITAVALLAAVTGWWLLLRARHRAGHAAGAVAAGAALVVLVASPNYLRARLEEILDARLTYYEEGTEATVAVYDSERAGRPVLVINNNALDDRGVVHKLLAHVPMLLVENPQRALVLGFGVGISSESLSAYDIPVNDCVEISHEVMNAAPSFASLNGNVADRNDPNFRLFVEDGRKLLLRTAEPYDVIILDANSGNLRNAGVGKLYTRDFFELCRTRLAPGGMISLYVSPNGTLREFKLMARTFLEVFPHASLWVDRVYGQTCMLVGGEAPLRVDLDRYLSRLGAEKVQADLRGFGLEQPGALLACFLAGEGVMREFCRSSAVNTDDRPLVEFFPLRMHLFDGDDRMFSDGGFSLVREPITPYLAPSSPSASHAEVRAFLASADRAAALTIDSWLYRWNSNASMAAANLRAAASLHPEAEYLRLQLGYGTGAAMAASARAVETRSFADLGRAGLLAYRREDFGTAANLLTQALAAPGADTARARIDYTVALSRSRREMGALEEARVSLSRAQAWGFDPTVDALDLALAGTNGDRVREDALLEELAGALLQRVDVVRAVEVLLELRRRGPLDGHLALTAGRALETFGDPAGAYLFYEESLASGAATPEATQGLERTKAEIALRLDFHTRASGSDGARAALVSPFLGREVPASAIPSHPYDRADGWLELAERNLQGGLTFSSYRKARVARAAEPDRPETYAAVGRAAAALGNEPVARLAYRRARELGLDAALIPPNLAR